MASGSLFYMAGPMDGYGACAICQRYAVKVTILTVTSASNPDMMDCFVTSSTNPEVIVCPCPIVKVIVVMVMSSGNLDVMSHL